jgi:nucleotide-binding universal stress UspA family protein
MKSLEAKVLPNRVGPIRKVLVAVNLSEHSEATASYAAQIAKYFDASLTIAFVCQPVPLGEYTCESTYTLLEGQRSDLQKMLEELACKMEKTGVACRSAFLVGEPAEQILTLAHDMGADLIVTASHHLTLLKRIFKLDKAAQIVRRASCPVLVYKEKNAALERASHGNFGIVRGARPIQTI